MIYQITRINGKGDSKNGLTVYNYICCCNSNIFM